MNLKTYSYRQTHKTQRELLCIPLKIKDISIIDFAYAIKLAFMPQEIRSNFLPLPLHLHCRPDES